MNAALDAERGLIDTLASASSELDQLESTLERLHEHAAELKDVEDRLLTAQEKDAASFVAESNFLGEADREVTNVIAWPDTVTSAVDGLEATIACTRPYGCPELGMRLRYPVRLSKIWSAVLCQMKGRGCSFQSATQASTARIRSATP